MSSAIPLHVLILEDHPADAELMLDHLRHAGFEPEWSLVDNEADYLAQLDSVPEIILADYSLPEWDAPSALHALQTRGLDVPFIIVSGTIGEEKAIECIKHGAADFLLKDRLARLGQAVEHALETKRLRDQQQQAEEVARSRARMQNLMGELGMRAMQSSDLAALLNAAVAGVASALEVAYCSLLELRADGQTLLLRAGVGWKAGLVGQATLPLEPDSQAAYLVRTQAPLLVDDFPGETRFRTPNLLLEHGVISGLSVLIHGRGQPVGMLSVFTAARRTFTTDHAYLLQGVAELLSAAFERKRAENELRKLYRAIEQSASSVIITDQRGNIEYVNPHFTQVTGYSTEEVIGKNPRILKSGETPLEVYQQLWATILAGGEWRGEFHNRKKSGDLFWELASISAVKDSDGQITHLLAVKEDITERKQAEAKLAKLNRTLAVLSEVNQTIVRIRVPSELFAKVCQIAVDLGGFRMAWIGMFDPETTRVNPVASAGISDHYVEKLGIMLSDELRGHGPTGSALRASEHVIINDLEHDSRMAPWRENALTLGYRAAAAFPLIVADKVRGSFGLYADQPDFFNDQECRLLDEMAEDISFAMEYAEQEAWRQQAEMALNEHAQALGEMHRFLQTTLDAFPAHTAVLDPDGTILNVNATWARFADENHAPSPLYYLGDNYLTLCDAAAGPWSDEAAPAAAGIRAVIDGTRDDFSLEYPCHSPSEQRWFTLRVTPFPDPAPRRVVVAHVNVTERRLAEEAIRALNADLEGRVVERTAQYVSAKERAEAILNNSSDAILLCRTDGAIEQTNPAADLILGSRSDELQNQWLVTLAVPQEAARLEAAFHTLLDSRLSQRLEITVQQYDGSRFGADVMLSPVFGQEEMLTGVVCVLHDITERKQMEDSLRSALEKERELGQLKTQFVSIVSHEFRNPLASILSAADLMVNYADRMSDERKRQHLSAIQEQVQHLTGLMNDVLLIGKAENVGFEFAPAPLDLAAFCQAVVAQMQQTTGTSHTILLSTEGQCSVASADEKLLRHVLTNLLSNAVKYSPEGSTVSVELRCDPGQATLRVRDHGIGIPVEEQPRLFEAFHRASNVGMTPGTGLGLAITKRAVVAHGGTIAFESAAGQGTTFTITFPIR